MCYPPISQIREGMKLSADYLDRSGYRLPTEAEWEFGCGLGLGTRWPFGSDEKMLRHYAWCIFNSSSHAWPVGLLKPNELGLFDVVGNVYEWCHPRNWQPPSHPDGRPVDDLGSSMVIRSFQDSVVLRGGYFESKPSNLEMSYRNTNRPEIMGSLIGFRLAKSCK
jgi:formylglycine-generating enzyme required for sulfatase activity